MRRVVPLFLLASLLAAAAGGACRVRIALFGSDSLEEKVLVPSRSRDKVLVIDVDGIISSSGGSGLLSREKSMPARVAERLDAARRDRNIRAVILNIDSPGGEVAASDIIHHEITRFKAETGRPVVVMMLGMAASGGYYVAMAGDHVLAQPTTLTGSIGVISIFPDFHLLMTKIGIAVNVIKSGGAKDSGSPFRDMTGDEKALFQTVIDDYFEKFLAVVAANRRAKLGPEGIRRLADGRVFTADQALKAGLIDGIGYFETAYKKAMELAGIKAARIVTYTYDPAGKTSIYAGPPDIRTDAAAGQGYIEALLPRLRSGFYYLWLPETGANGPGR